MKRALCFLIALCCSMAVAGAAPLLDTAAENTAAPANPNQPAISLVYPKDGATIAASSTFLVGAVPPGTALSCNGQPVRVNDLGFFAHVVPLHPGANSFTLAAAAPASATRSLTVTREMPRPPLAPGSFAISGSGVQPDDNVGVAPGDLLQLAVHATPGGQVTAFLANRQIALQPAAATGKHGTAKINLGLDAAYGRMFQRRPGYSPDLYTGFYRIAPDDKWQSVKPRFVLTKGGRKISLTAKATVTVVYQPRAARTIHEQTIVRTAPGAARTTPLPSGVRLLVDGWQGDSMRCLMSPTKHTWILKEDLVFEEKSGLPPGATVRTMNISGDSKELKVAVPLGQRLPFEIEQQMHPDRLTLKVYGATADTDWITPAPSSDQDSLVDNITWRQPEDGVYEVTLRLRGKRQWGFWADYDGLDLVLHIKQAPQVVPGAGPLNGITVCIDPGHGGKETGAIGPSGVKEATINLAIAEKLAQLLQSDGAHVVMTRTADVDVSLGDRVQTAIAAGADILVSVHNNSLPDGRDPWREHGSSTYWYHPQSIELAQTIKKSLVAEAGFSDYGTFYGNLALTRPSNMPAVLAEIGFMINPDEYARLLQQTTQQQAAAAIRDALVAYFQGPAVGDQQEKQ